MELQSPKMRTTLILAFLTLLVGGLTASAIPNMGGDAPPDEDRQVYMTYDLDTEHVTVGYVAQSQPTVTYATPIEMSNDLHISPKKAEMIFKAEKTSTIFRAAHDSMFIPQPSQTSAEVLHAQEPRLTVSNQRSNKPPSPSWE